MHPHVRFALVLPVVLFLAGCVAPQSSGVRPEARTLVRPGARVVIESVTNTSGQNPVPDLVPRLQEALSQALQHEGLFTTDTTGNRDLRLTLSITRYEPGNAFKRWLIPGYGSTILEMNGDLKDAATGSKVGAITYSRSVSAGGLYTVGAWSTIITDTATELVRDLKLQIEGEAEKSSRNFVLTARPRAQEGVATPPGADSITVRVEPVDDQRAEQVRIGERFAAFKVKMSDVYLSRNAASFLREALTDEIQLAGRRVTDADADVTARLRVNKLWVYTDPTALYWDIIGEFDCDLILEPSASGPAPITRHFAARKTDRTYVWPSETLMSKVLNASLDDVFVQIKSDGVWTSIPHRLPP